jgi:hypothetical protein
MKPNNVRGFNSFSTGRHYVGALGTVVMLSRVHNSAVEQAEDMGLIEDPHINYSCT